MCLGIEIQEREGEGRVGLDKRDWADECDTTADITRNEDIGVRRGLVSRSGSQRSGGSWREQGGCMHSINLPSRAWHGIRNEYLLCEVDGLLPAVRGEGPNLCRNSCPLLRDMIS